MRSARTLIMLILLLPLVATTLAAAPVVEEPGAAQGQQPHGPPVSFDFDDGLQGWTIETSAECGDGFLSQGVIDDGAGTLQPTPSNWERQADVDNHDRGLQGRGDDPADHHMAVVQYRNCTDTRLVSPEFVGDGSPVTLSFDQRHWTEGGFDFLHVEWSGEAGGWTALDSCDGRGRYPLWDRVSVTLTPEGPFQVSFHMVSDRARDGRGRFNRRLRAFEASRGGLGVWIDDVHLVSGASVPLPCVPGQSEENTENRENADRGTTDAAPAATRRQDGPAGTDSSASGERALPATSPTGVPSGSDPVGLQVHELLVDRSTHPEYHDMLNQDLIEIDRWLSDPYRWDWDGTRGRMRDVWLLNRYDAPLAGTLYAPLEEDRYPTVVFVGGAGFSDHPGYGSLLQRLAEEGYVVLSVSPQGHLGLGDRLSAVKPAREFCGEPAATADVWWRQPQEAGLVEAGFCAGEITGIPDYDCAGEVNYTGCIYVDERTGNGDAFADHTNRVNQEVTGPSFTFAVTDALAWLLGPDNPWRHLVDRDRIATAGHSAGGFGAMVAANVHQEISAAVALDPGGRWPKGLGQLDTPTLVIGAESAIETGGGTIGIQDPADTTARQNQRDVVNALRDRGVDAGWVVLADATHNDFAYLPYPHQFDTAQNSRWAQPVTHHYLLAWFDHHLKGLSDARERLLADTFDDTADRTAIGVGRWNPVDGNVPYRIEDRTVAQHLSERFPNWIHLGGETTQLR